MTVKLYDGMRVAFFGDAARPRTLRYDEEHNNWLTAGDTGRVHATFRLEQTLIDWLKDETYVPIQDDKPAEPEHDAVAHPKHYTAHPSGVECIQITEHMGFNLGNAVRYIWRCDLKQDAIEDLKKARWYVDREIAKREKAR